LCRVQRSFEESVAGNELSAAFLVTVQVGDGEAEGFSVESGRCCGYALRLMWRDLGISEKDWAATLLAVRTTLLALQQQVHLPGIRFTAYEKQITELREQVSTVDDLKAEIAELRQQRRDVLGYLAGVCRGALAGGAHEKLTPTRSPPLT
jgi:hypothetical protein